MPTWKACWQDIIDLAESEAEKDKYEERLKIRAQILGALNWVTGGIDNTCLAEGAINDLE